MSGRTPGAGRKPGVPNKATAEIKALAREYGAAAIARLAHLMAKAESERAQVAAAKEILDRGYGKSPQAVQLSGVIGHRDASEYTDGELAAIIARGSGPRTLDAPRRSPGDNSVH